LRVEPLGLVGADVQHAEQPRPEDDRHVGGRADALALDELGEEVVGVGGVAEVRLAAGGDAGRSCPRRA
jgi:hypothetical protein